MVFLLSSNNNWWFCANVVPFCLFRAAITPYVSGGPKPGARWIAALVLPCCCFCSSVFGSIYCKNAEMRRPRNAFSAKKILIENNFFIPLRAASIFWVLFFSIYEFKLVSATLTIVYWLTNNMLDAYERTCREQVEKRSWLCLLWFANGKINTPSGNLRLTGCHAWLYTIANNYCLMSKTVLMCTGYSVLGIVYRVFNTFTNLHWLYWYSATIVGL